MKKTLLLRPGFVMNRRYSHSTEVKTDSDGTTTFLQNLDGEQRVITTPPNVTKLILPSLLDFSIKPDSFKANSSPTGDC